MTDSPWLNRGLWGQPRFDSAGVWDHLLWLCHTLVIEGQSLRINFSSGSLIIFNHPTEMKARVINMTSTDSMWGSLYFLSPPPMALTDEFNKRGALSASPRIEQLNYLRPCLHGFSSIDEYITVCSVKRNQSSSYFFILITDSVRSLPMERSVMTQTKLHLYYVKEKCSQHWNAFILHNLLEVTSTLLGLTYYKLGINCEFSSVLQFNGWFKKRRAFISRTQKV